MEHDTASEEIARIEDEDTAIGRSILDELLPEDKPRLRYLVAGVAIVLALVSIFVLADWASSPETHAGTISALDEKRATVMRLVAGSTGTSAAITLLPGDVGTPIAEKLLDLGADFAIVIGAIYLEKYLLTILGLAAFRFVIPAGCILFAIVALLRRRTGLRQLLFQLSGRLLLFGIAIFLVVPASVAISDLIEVTYESTMSDTLAAVEQTAGEADAGDAEPEAGSQEGLDALVGFIQSIPENLSNVASGVSEEVQAALNRFIETFAVMIVTSCVIPILVLLFFLWLIRIILGVPIDVPTSARAPLLRGRPKS
ncbi:hypothetical protein EII22_09760 [Coriobacteriales bacterium OH1046]|nr:hypothetical protein EII22_09760 [Coriobacteriales bacterium OH1046]